MAIKLNPQAPEFRTELGVVLLQQGQLEDAISNLRRAVQQRNMDPAAHYVLARALQKAGRPGEASREFQEATALNQAKLGLEQAGLLTINGIADLRAGRIADAAQKLRQAVARKPDYPEANYYLGIALAQSGDAAGSIQGFQTALEKRPQSAEIHYNFGIALWQMGKGVEAIHEFRLAIQLNPHDGLAHCALGKALLRQGTADEGENELRRAHELGACQPATAALGR
jgi:Flp pilus assembly protein TadD